MMFDDAVQQAMAVKNKAETAIVKLGTVTSVSNGRALVQHYGESTPSTKKYTAIDGYFPEVGDKVAMLPQGNTYIIIGKVIDAAPVQKYATFAYVDEVAAGLLPVAYKNKLEDSEHSSESLTFSNYVLLPTTDNKDVLGSSSKYFKEAYIKKLFLNGTEYTEISMDRIVVKSGSTTYSLIATVSNGYVTLTPSSNDKWKLGTKNYQLNEAWLGLFRGSWKSGNTTERQVSWNNSNALVPDTNNSINLGTSSLGFAKLFIDTIIGAKSQYQDGSTNYVAWSSSYQITPNNSNTVEIGSSTKQLNKVYAKEFYINGTKLDITGLTTNELIILNGSTEYKLTLSVKSPTSTAQYGALEPSINEKFDLGSTSYKFRNIYTKEAYVNGTAVSSDRRKKKDIEPLDERYEEFFKALRPVSFEYKEIPGKHTGFIAQEVEEAAEEAGIDKDIAVVVEPESGDYYLRYEELIAVQTKMIQELMQKVENLEARIKKLEAKGEN